MGDIGSNFDYCFPMSSTIRIWTVKIEIEKLHNYANIELQNDSNEFLNVNPSNITSKEWIATTYFRLHTIVDLRFSAPCLAHRVSTKSQRLRYEF